MKNVNFFAIGVFMIALTAMAGLELASSEYEFIPEQPSIAKSSLAPSTATGPSEEIISRFSRTTGSLDSGDAQVNVIFMNPIREMPSDNLFFQIMIDTSSLDLSDYDIEKMVSLEDNNGMRVIDGFDWELLHKIHNNHIMGVLIAPDLSWLRTSYKEAKYLKLTIEGIPNIDKREYQWNKSVS